MQTYGFDEARAWEAVNHYRERFRVTGLYENRVFDGIPELLEALVGRGHTLYVATSKPGVFAREIARHFAFDRHFKAIYGSELDGTRTHKDELIRHLLDSEGLAAEHCLMIGDRMHDLLGASLAVSPASASATASAAKTNCARTSRPITAPTSPPCGRYWNPTDPCSVSDKDA